MATPVVYRSLSGSEIHAVIGNVKFGDIQMVKYAISRQKAPMYTMGSADLRAIARGQRSINGALVFAHLSTDGIVGIMRDAGHKIFLSHDELANNNADYHDRGKLTPEFRQAMKASGTVGYVGYINNEIPGGSQGGANVAGAGTSYASNGASILRDINTRGANGNGSGWDPFAEGQGIDYLGNYGRLTHAWLADQLPPFDITLIGIPETAGEEIAAAADTFRPQRLVIRGVEFVSESSGTSIEDLVIEKQHAFIARTVSPWTKIDFK